MGRELLLLLLLLLAGSARAPRPSLELPLKGLAVGLHALEPGHSYLPQIELAKTLGADAVSFTVALPSSDVHSHRIGAPTVEEASLRRVIRQARARGLRTLVMPFIRLEMMREGEWRGNIQPDNWELWWRAYRGRIVALARLAEQERVDIFSVGSELCSSEHFDDRWRQLIGEVRRYYHGAVTYSANWDHLDSVHFAPELDLAGMNAYFELASPPSGRQAELHARWERLKPGLLGWAESSGRPLLITEIGYPSLEGGLRWPWDYTREAPVSLEEQRLGYEAFLAAWWGEPGLAGVFFYELWGAGGPLDGGYTPRGKPAAETLRRWWSPERTVPAQSWSPVEPEPPPR